MHVQRRRRPAQEPAGLKPVLVFTQGDPAGIGPELLLRLLAADRGEERSWAPLVVAQRAALEAHAPCVPAADLDRFIEMESPTLVDLESIGEERIAFVQPPSGEERVVPGRPSAEGARAALRALDLGVELVQAGPGSGLVTAPVSKESISTHARAAFVGHTGYLAEGAGLEGYGSDHLMCFLTEDLQVALLSTHLPLQAAIQAVSRESILAALECLHRHAGGRIAVAGLNPHAGEGGLLGDEENRTIRPAVEAARARGIDVHGPFSADSLFARCRRREFDWALALYHDQGLVAVKTAAFGSAVRFLL